MSTEQEELVKKWCDGLLRSAITESFRRGWRPSEMKKLIDFLWRERKEPAREKGAGSD